MISIEVKAEEQWLAAHITACADLKIEFTLEYIQELGKFVHFWHIKGELFIF